MSLDYRNIGITRTDLVVDGLPTVKLKYIRGELTVTTHAHHPDWQLNDLLDFAERINPKRAFLFVSKVLGKHIPVKPSVMSKVYRDLASQLPLLDPESKTTVVAMAETAVGLGAGIYRELKFKEPEIDSVFMCTTRATLKDAQVMGEFHEEHSHATRHFLYKSADQSINDHVYDTETLILVDDEITTGKTLSNLYAELKKIGLGKIKKVFILTLVDWSNSENYAEFDGVEVSRISLLSGSWSWENSLTGEFVEPKTPDTDEFRYIDGEIVTLNNWGRLPVRDLPTPTFRLDVERCDGPIHILGAREYLWIPFLLAEQLEEMDFDVVFSSSTCSPIKTSELIKNSILILAKNATKANTLAYNVDSKERMVYLLTETPEDRVCTYSVEERIETVNYRHEDPILLCDMDDTLFQTERRHPIQSDSVAASYRVDGRPIGYMTGTQNKFVSWILKNSMVIPVTARDKAALGRISMKFNYGAVCCHGGLVLTPNGDVDQEWLRLQKPIIDAVREDMLEIEQMASAFDKHGARSWIVAEGDMPMYVVVKKDVDSTVSLEGFAGNIKAIYGDKFYFHINARNLAIIPLGVSKKRASEYLIGKFNQAGQKHPVLGFGDSLSDYGFMSLCDFVGIPKTSQLNNVLATEVQRLYTENGFYG